MQANSQEQGTQGTELPNNRITCAKTQRPRCHWRGAAGYKDLLLCSTKEREFLIKGILEEVWHCNCKSCLRIVSVAVS